MAFKILYSGEALSQLRKLDNATAKRILDKLDATLENPAHFFERLAGRDEYKLRVGNYRVLAKVFISDNIVSILSVGHRKNIYERLK